MGATVTSGHRAALKRAIKRFETAVEDHAFIGTIPAGESDEAAAAYAQVEYEYARSRECLEKLIDRYLS